MLQSVVEEIEVSVMSQVDISNFPWTEFNLIENRSEYIGDTLGLRRKKRTRGIHRFEFELVTVEMEQSVGRGVKAQISDACDGTLTFIHPRLSYSQGITPVDLSLNNSYPIGLREIALTSGNIWQLKAGDYIQFDNHNKVYEVARDTNLQSGVQVVRLTFSLKSALNINDVVIVNDVTWYLISDSIIEVDTNASDNQDMQIILNVVEDI